SGMTWSPFLTLVTPGPTSTTTPAPSWPRIDGNNPSGSAPESVNSSVWQIPVALISTSTSEAFAPSSSTSVTVRCVPPPTRTPPQCDGGAGFHGGFPPQRLGRPELN